MSFPPKYVIYDYENDHDNDLDGPNGFWHIYTLDDEPEDLVLFDAPSLLSIRMSNTSENEAAIKAITEAIEIAIDRAIAEKTTKA